MQNSVVTFEQDFVVPQVMESGPITKVCQYNHQKFKYYSIVSDFADTAGVVWCFDSDGRLRACKIRHSNPGGSVV